MPGSEYFNSEHVCKHYFNFQHQHAFLLGNFVFCRSTSELRSPEMLVTTDVNTPILDVAEILRNSGLKSLRPLTSAETICAEETPGIGWHLFCETFGGRTRTEWPNCIKKSGYESFLCANAAVQPFMPRDPGKPGLVLRLPAVTGSSQNDKSTFHVLATMAQGSALYYRGKYAKIPLPQLQFKWENLPRQVCIAEICY